MLYDLYRLGAFDSENEFVLAILIFTSRFASFCCKRGFSGGNKEKLLLVPDWVLYGGHRRELKKCGRFPMKNGNIRFKNFCGRWDE